MALNYVTLTVDLYDGQGNVPTSGTASFTPSVQLTDTTNHEVIIQAPVVVSFKPTGPPTVKLLATDNSTPAPSGWVWTVAFSGVPGSPAAFSFFLPFTGGASQNLSSLTPVSAPGTATGALVIAAAPGASPGALPIGYGESTALTGLQVASSHPSDDVSDGTDGTGRLYLYSYQRANTSSFGETIRNFLMRYDAKAMTSWYGPVDLYNGSGDAIGTDGWRPWAWAGAHYEANDDASIHAHYEIEVPDTTGAMQGRLSITFGDIATGDIGLDKSNIVTNLADFTFQAAGLDHTGSYQEQYLRVAAAAGKEKPIEWNNSSVPANIPTGVRWRLLANSTSESGSNVGTDLAIQRYSDAGSLLATPVLITRSTGLVTLTGGLAVTGNANITGQLAATASASPSMTFTGTATGQQIVQSVGADSTSVAYEAQVTGDSINRWRCGVDGKMSWGTGAASRDTQLARTAAGQLSLTDLASAGNAYLLIGGSLLAGATATLGDGGVGVVAIANATTTPGTTPTGGGVLYVQSGALKYIGSSGTVTTLGAA